MNIKSFSYLLLIILFLSTTGFKGFSRIITHPEFDKVNGYSYLKPNSDEVLVMSVMLQVTSSLSETQQKFERKYLDTETKNNKSIISKKINTYRIITIVLVILVLLSIFLLFYIFRNLKDKKDALEKDRLDNELEIKRKELTLIISHKVKYNEIIHDLIKQLDDVQQELTKTNKPKLTPIIKELSTNEDDSLWDEFEIRFRDVHEEFYDELILRYPNLTPVEIKICAFLKLNLNTKEMAELTHKSPASIEVDRARVRKKLGLTNTNTKLSTFINNI